MYASLKPSALLPVKPMARSREAVAGDAVLNAAFAVKRKEVSGGAGNEPASDASVAASKLGDASVLPATIAIVKDAAGPTPSTGKIPTLIIPFQGEYSCLVNHQQGCAVPPSSTIKLQRSASVSHQAQCSSRLVRRRIAREREGEGPR